MSSIVKDKGETADSMIPKDFKVWNHLFFPVEILIAEVSCFPLGL
jgi:hypothetical protein